MIAGLDIGSSSVKLLLAEGEKQHYIFRSPHSNKSVKELWKSIQDVFNQADRFEGCSKIEALGITSQSCSYILYDGTDECPFYDWSYPTDTNYAEQVRKLFTQKEFVKYTSMLCPPMNAW